MKIIIDEHSEDIRIDVMLADIMKNMSRSKLQSCIKNGTVLVNNKTVKPSYITKEDDAVEIN